MDFQFYVPDVPEFRELPSDESVVWKWICEHPHTPSGRTIWTIYTCRVLQKRGFSCWIVRKFPARGIVVSHRDFLPSTLLPRSNVFLVCLKPDRKEHSWAHVHLVQNGLDPILERSSRTSAMTVPYWPQPSLLERDRSRGTRVEVAAYFGRPLNLDRTIQGPAWQAELASGGFTWREVSMSQWHNYSDVDVTVSIRRFENSAILHDPTMSPDTKPPSKLVNSWFAGVPAIVGDESAYRAIQKSHLDFLLVRSKAELIDALRHLRKNPGLYSDMVENGRDRSRAYSIDAVSDAWQAVLSGPVRQLCAEWQAKNISRRSFENWSRFLEYWLSPKNVHSAARGFLRRH